MRPGSSYPLDVTSIVSHPFFRFPSNLSDEFQDELVIPASGCESVLLRTAEGMKVNASEERAQSNCASLAGAVLTRRQEHGGGDEPLHGARIALSPSTATRSPTLARPPARLRCTQTTTQTLYTDNQKQNIYYHFLF